MTLSPRARFGARILAYATLALISFVFALHLTFPYDRVKEKVEDALATKYDVKIGGVERSVMPGRFSLTAVTLRSRPTVANQPVTTMFFKSIEIDIAFLPLLGRRLEIGLDIATTPGSIAGVIRLSKQATAVDFTLRSVPLATIPGIADAVGLPLFGNGDGRVVIDLPEGDWSKAKGQINLACKVGCVVGDGVTKIYPKARREADQAFVKDGTVVPEIKITRFELGVDIGKGEMKTRKFEFVSPDGEVEVDFNIKLAKKIGESTILGCLSYKCSEALKTRVPKFAGTCDFSSAAIDERGFHDIKLVGPLATMRRLGTSCDATTGESSASGGERVRPKLDDSLPQPLEPLPSEGPGRPVGDRPIDPPQMEKPSEEPGKSFEPPPPGVPEQPAPGAPPEGMAPPPIEVAPPRDGEVPAQPPVDMPPPDPNGPPPDMPPPGPAPEGESGNTPPPHDPGRPIQ